MGLDSNFETTRFVCEHYPMGIGHSCHVDRFRRSSVNQRAQWRRTADLTLADRKERLKSALGIRTVVYYVLSLPLPPS